MYTPLKMRNSTLENLPDEFYTSKHYNLLVDISYVDRYLKTTFIPKGTESDGASGAFDIKSVAWWVHDQLCKNGCWDDGTPITNWQASIILGDILWEEKRWFRSAYWKWSTFLLGCKLAKKNGMFRLKKELRQ